MTFMQNMEDAIPFLKIFHSIIIGIFHIKISFPFQIPLQY